MANPQTTRTAKPDYAPPPVDGDFYRIAAVLNDEERALLRRVRDFTEGVVAPVIEELAAEMAGRVRFAKLNVDENPATASRFGARSIPTLLVIQGGREVDRIVGAQPKAEIARRLERFRA